jgi:hypothetical protein
MSVAADMGTGKKRRSPGPRMASMRSPPPRATSAFEGTMTQRIPATSRREGSVRKKAPGKVPPTPMPPRRARVRQGTMGS